MRTSILLTLLLIFIAVPLNAQQPSSSVTLRVIPAPREVRVNVGEFRLNSATRIILGGSGSAQDRFAAEQLIEHLIGLKGPQLRAVAEQSVRKLSSNFVFVGSSSSPMARQFLKDRGGNLTEAMKAEGYFLHVNRDGAVVIAASPAGRFYGVMSLLQMITREKRVLAVPAVAIHDWPLQGIRGITDDLSRGQVSTLENFKKIVRFLARHKLNVYCPYIEDIFVWTSHPKIGKGRGELTAAEMKELDAYAKQRHVELIPIFETLGHWENMLLLPDYAKYGEFPGAHTVNVSDEAVYTMLDEMIGELASAFSSPWFNMAADESWDVGLGVNKERVAKSDIATVHAEHYKRLFEIIARHGKKPMMYGDIILDNPAIIEKIPKDVVIVDWQYYVAERYTSPAVFRNAGMPFVVSPAVWNFTGPFPNYINTFVNVRNLTREGYLNGALGVLTSNWNDYGGETLREFNYYGYAWTAECAWSPLTADLNVFNSNFFEEFFGDRAAGEAVQMAYVILSDALNQVHWNEFWRHPMLPVRPSALNYLWRVQSIESTMPLVHALVDKARATAVRNQDHLVYLEFIARLHTWFGKKLKHGEIVRRLTQELPAGSDPDSVNTAALALIEGIAPDLMKLKEEFRKAWLTTNRPANLEWLERRYDRQAAYWNEKADELRKGQTWVDPVIGSQWVYHPMANPGTRDSALTQVPRAWFTKEVVLEEAPREARIQLIGNTHCRLWVNGQEVGEVFARRSLSLIVEYERVKVFDVTGIFRPGRNVLSVEAVNYQHLGSGGVNVYGETVLANGGVSVLTSDSTWFVTDTAPNGWPTQPQSETAWVPARAFPFPTPVVRPNFAGGRSSWIER